jgi:hypothetical protein
MFKLNINLDAHGEAQEFINTHSTLKGRALANKLNLKGTGSATLATAFSNYAWNAHTAQGCRLSGKIDRALMYERIADRIYTEDIQPNCICW